MIRLYDTLAREKRVFEPADPGRITMYVCGPTVYNRAHIGNARPAVVFDVLARLLRHSFPTHEIQYVRNYTDVDDKIIATAEEEAVEPSIITQRYERFYEQDMGALGVERPWRTPRATENIADMIAMIGRLIAAANAYEADGHVLFNVPSDPDYGALSRRDREAMVAGARVEVAAYKKDPADFVLWKPSPEGVIGWDSPWGRGRPGWHIECSAMIERHLGETIDIHGGGLDLIFPHHENEIAQSRCAHGGAPLARHWLHNGFLSMADGEKMSKSLGNVVTVDELLEQGHQGEVLRLALLSAHYRQPLEWSDALIAQSKATLDRLYRTAGDGESGEPDEGVVEALSDDLNTPLALSRLSAIRDEATLRASGRLFGLLDQDASGWFRGEGDAGVDDRIAARADAKKRRDFAEADRIRAELAKEGIVLEDSAQGTDLAPRLGALGAILTYIEQVTTALYDRDILRLAASIPHQGRLERAQASVEKRSPLCGSRVRVDVRLDEQGRVADLGQEVRACALGQAAASLMGAHAIGRDRSELAEARDRLAAFLAGDRDDPGGWPGLDIFRDARPYKARHPSILLAFEAAAEAVAEAAR